MYLNDERRALAVRPLAHGTVVVSRAVIAKKLKYENSVRRTDATLSISYDFLIRRRTHFFEHRPKIISRLDSLMAVVGDEIQPFEVYGSRNASRPRVASGIAAVPFAIGAHIQEHDVFIAHVGDARSQACIPGQSSAEV